MALQWMRGNMRYLKWFLWVVIAAFVVLFGNDWSGVNQGDRTRVAAFVGDEEISTEEVRNQFRNLENYYRQIFGERYNSDMAQQLNLVGQALQGVVERKILLHEARDLGLMATDLEVRDEILSYPAFRDENDRFIGAEEYKGRVRAAGFKNTKAFEQALRDDILRRKLDAILAQTLYISDSELEAVYRAQADKAKLRYLFLPGSTFADLEVDEERMAEYFAENQELFRLPEQRAVDYVLVDALKLRREIEIPEAEMKAYYDDHADEFTQEEQVRARHILLQVTPTRTAEEATAQLNGLRKRIEAGEDFGVLATEHSDEPDSAKRGGSLGYFGRNAWGEDFTEIVFGAKPNTLVGPVETQYGFHLIEVQENRPGGLRPFAEAQARIKNRLLGDQANELGEARARALAEKMPDTASAGAFRTTATEAGYTVETTAPFGTTDAIPGFGRGELNRVAFESTVDSVSEPIKVPRGWLVVRLAEIEAPRMPALEEVEERVQPLVLVEAQKAAALARLEEARARLDGGEDLATVAVDLGLGVQESAEVGVGDTIPAIGNNPAVINAALALDVGDFGGPFEAGQGAVLFEVTERKTFDPAAFAEAKDETRETEATQRLAKLRAALVAQRTKDLDVRYNPEALAVFGLDIEQFNQPS